MNEEKRQSNCRGKEENNMSDKIGRKRRKRMKAVLIIPIETLKGKLREDGYYFRMYRGQQLVQKCPRKWKDTPARKAAREKFIASFAQKKDAASRSAIGSH